MSPREVVSVAVWQSLVQCPCSSSSREDDLSLVLVASLHCNPPNLNLWFHHSTTAKASPHHLLSHNSLANSGESSAFFFSLVHFCHAVRQAAQHSNKAIDCTFHSANFVRCVFWQRWKCNLQNRLNLNCDLSNVCGCRRWHRSLFYCSTVSFEWKTTSFTSARHHASLSDRLDFTFSLEKRYQIIATEVFLLREFSFLFFKTWNEQHLSAQF